MRESWHSSTSFWALLELSRDDRKEAPLLTCRSFRDQLSVLAKPPRYQLGADIKIPLFAGKQRKITAKVTSIPQAAKKATSKMISAIMLRFAFLIQVLLHLSYAFLVEAPPAPPPDEATMNQPNCSTIAGLSPSVQGISAGVDYLNSNNVYNRLIENDHPHGCQEMYDNVAESDARLYLCGNGGLAKPDWEYSSNADAAMAFQAIMKCCAKDFDGTTLAGGQRWIVPIGLSDINFSKMFYVTVHNGLGPR